MILSIHPSFAASMPARKNVVSQSVSQSVKSVSSMNVPSPSLLTRFIHLSCP